MIALHEAFALSPIPPGSLPVSVSAAPYAGPATSTLKVTGKWRLYGSRHANHRHSMTTPNSAHNAAKYRLINSYRNWHSHRKTLDNSTVKCVCGNIFSTHSMAQYTCIMIPIMIWTKGVTVFIKWEYLAEGSIWGATAYISVYELRFKIHCMIRSLNDVSKNSKKI